MDIDYNLIKEQIDFLHSGLSELGRNLGLADTSKELLLDKRIALYEVPRFPRWSGYRAIAEIRGMDTYDGHTSVELRIDSTDNELAELTNQLIDQFPKTHLEKEYLRLADVSPIGLKQFIQLYAPLVESDERYLRVPNSWFMNGEFTQINLQLLRNRTTCPK